MVKWWETVSKIRCLELVSARRECWQMGFCVGDCACDRGLQTQQLQQWIIWIINISKFSLWFGCGCQIGDRYSSFWFDKHGVFGVTKPHLSTLSLCLWTLLNCIWRCRRGVRQRADTNIGCHCMVHCTPAKSQPLFLCPHLHCCAYLLHVGKWSQFVFIMNLYVRVFAKPSPSNNAQSHSNNLFFPQINTSQCYAFAIDLHYSSSDKHDQISFTTM